MVINNHFPCKDLVPHPIDSQPFINGWPSASRSLVVEDSVTLARRFGSLQQLCPSSFMRQKGQETPWMVQGLQTPRGYRCTMVSEKDKDG